MSDKVRGVHKSRYLALYCNGLSMSYQCRKGAIKLKKFPYFWEWLEQLTFDDGTKLTKDEIEEIYNYMTWNFVRKKC